ncbi:pantoate--beta-alanine ligase [Desulfohalovibrio reitneri]|uniref:pantoate--beta-alanine ligase n=1 Tax=Desulfohalovibrio reitneri TaxID=1307759 RepID=UPI0004A71651|nr:pantoate--beta-alanine ligase [Desulfohalovibrio reitneri]
MRIITDVDEFRAWSESARCEGRRVGLVPTMGALHEGHLSLIGEAVRRADAVAVSVFVNPAQFAPGEDYETYPRDLERDAALAGEHGADVVFAPPPGAMYPEGESTRVTVEGVSEGLCARTRPHFFGGVALVVTKLLVLARPHVAVFGEKDRQQLAVIRRLGKDLLLDCEIAGHPTVREEDGLAMSSRNVYLTQAERAQAPGLYRGLLDLKRRLEEGERDAAELLAGLEDFYAREVPDGEIDYLELVDPETMRPVERVDGEAVAAVAVRLGRARLIDNIVVSW